MAGQSNGTPPLPMNDEAVLQHIIAAARVSEPTGTHRMTVIMLCGFMEADSSRLVRWFQRLSEHGVSFEAVRLVGLVAPKRPITCYDGWQTPAWFDYITETYDTEDLINIEHLAQSRRLLTQIVDAEVARLGGSADRLVLLGFSQGGNMAYDVALNYSAQLGGLIARRTSLRNESKLGSHRTLPIVHFHGEEDDGIGCNRGKAGITRLRAAGFTHVALNTQPGLNHVDYSTNEMEVYAAFLKSLFPYLSITAETDAPAVRHHVQAPKASTRTKKSRWGWLLGLVHVQQLMVTLWQSLATLLRPFRWKVHARRAGTGSGVIDRDRSDTTIDTRARHAEMDADGFQLPVSESANQSRLTTPGFANHSLVTRTLTEEGRGWANAATADMARRNARSTAPFSQIRRRSSKAKAEEIDGNYIDANHPNGFRMIKLNDDGSSAVIVGNDDAKTGVTFTLYGRVIGTSIEIDFTPKARRVGKLVGVWDGSGIVFADGNRWAKVPGLNEAFVLF